jgi:glucose-1-phosphate adenylyltransferase
MSNSGIDRIQVYAKNNPRSLVEHVGTGRHYNINSKSGKLQILFSMNDNGNDLYNTDIAAYIENMESIEKMHHPYVVIAPNYMIYSQDFAKLLQTHVDSGADISLLYHSVDNAREAYLTCNTLELNRQKGVLSIEPNRGNAKNKQIFMDTYVMKKELFVELVNKAHKTSSLYTLLDIINLECQELDIRGIAHRGYFASITDFRSYYDANMSLIDINEALNLFKEEWPIYTRTNNSSPTHYLETADIKTSVVSNGCRIEGSVEHSIVGRGCTIQKGAVVKNCIVLADVVIGEGVHVENQVIDKHSKLIHVKEIVGDPENPGYVKRRDTL